jgi:hypothetical protein
MIRGLIFPAALDSLAPMITKKSLVPTLLVLALFSFVRPASAIVFGQTDTFQDPNEGTMNWVNGASMVERIATGGPTGAGDAYLQVTSIGGGGPGSRLVAQNYSFPPVVSQWTGDYLAAGVDRIEFDLNNQSQVTLSIRLAFKTDVQNGSPGYLSLPVIVAPGSGWQHFSISLAQADLTPIGGPAPYDQFFQNGFNEMRFINEAGDSNLNGDPVVATLGIDNIHAIPEPATDALAAVGLLLLCAYLFRARRQSV